MAGPAHRKYALLRPTCLLVPPCAANRGIKTISVESALERLGFHDARVDCRSGIDRINVLGNAFLVNIDDYFEAEALRRLVAKRDHFSELPLRVDVEQREWWLCWEEGLTGKVQEHTRILAD